MYYPFNTTSHIESRQEYYNYAAQIMAFEYQPWGAVGAPEDPIREVHDYNLGEEK